MAARRSAAPPASIAPFAVLGAIAGVLAGAWFGYPGTVAAFVAVIAVGFTEPAPTLTGPKKMGGPPTPSGPQEQKLLESYRSAQSMRFSPLPGPSWAPGWPIQASWLFGLALAGVAATLPVVDNRFRAVAAVSAFATTVGLAYARRQGTGNPGTKTDTLLTLAKEGKVVPLVAGAVGGGIGGVVLGMVLLRVFALSPAGYPKLGWLLVAAVAITGAGLGVLPPWRKAALAYWRELCEVRSEWEPRWLVLKVDPAPDCTATEQVGAFRVTTFNASGGRSATDMMSLAGRLPPLLGAGAAAAVISTPNESSQGPVPGTVHPTKVQIVTWSSEQWPDLGDPSLGPEVVNLTVAVALNQGGLNQGYIPPPLPLEVSPIHADESTRAAYRVGLAWPGGPGPGSVRVGGCGASGLTAGRLGMAMLDHRAFDGNGYLYVGDLGSADLADDDTKLLTTIQDEDTWNAAWQAALKTGVNPPVIQPGQTAEAQLAGGGIVERYVFAVRTGLDPSELYTPGTERKLATSVGGPPFLTITGWIKGSQRPGDRHPQAFVVYKAKGRIPLIDGLAPVVRSEAPAWVISGHLNHAFDHIRQARPEVVSAKCLTKPESRGHIWEIRLRLFGGVSFGDVRTFGERLRQALGVAWLRVTPAEDGCTIFVGASPKRATLANPARDAEKLTRLDWEQAWVDAKVSGAGGQVPGPDGSFPAGTQREGGTARLHPAARCGPRHGPQSHPEVEDRDR